MVRRVNLLHNIHAIQHIRPGESKRYVGVGIYLDHATSKNVVKNNVVYNATIGWHNNGGQFNIIENNIFAGSELIPSRTRPRSVLHRPEIKMRGCRRPC